jgi:GT2 family glycosyltransferase
MDIDVIILTNSRQLSDINIAQRTILSLKDSEDEHTFHVHVMESGVDSPERFTKFCDNYVAVKESFNYNRYINHALKYLTHDWVVISNDDVAYEKGWFSEILKINELRPDIHSFSPRDPLYYAKYYPWHFIGSKDTYFENYQVSEAAMGWCFVIKKESFDKVIPFDELFDMYFQDNDYVERLKENGIKHALVRHSIASHLQTLTIKEEDSKKSKKSSIDELKFRKKWNIWK